MRVYLPVTLDEILGPFAARPAHAVTPALRAVLPDEDEETLEFAAQLAAADDALNLLAEHADAPRLRVVVSVDVPESAVGGVSDDALSPSTVELLVAVGREDIACAHVDEPAARADVEAALAGDEAALERLEERDLLWYDVSELGSVPR
ncbi:DUF6912 family protein [Cellulomonas biazotea]|uniref:Uncharacterized protein n=1 Tax=Cellulomonas biazotea TaxID=1709 RepID=A0A402DLX9_9CELL|nr:hypothetical protein [Cellulomonas biazotea]GCE75088.1 hypothetical protein CBZ_01440 [Cellulomonas biazotea]